MENEISIVIPAYNEEETPTKTEKIDKPSQLSGINSNSFSIPFQIW